MTYRTRAEMEQMSANANRLHSHISLEEGSCLLLASVLSLKIIELCS